MTDNPPFKQLLKVPVIVAALGYLVDMYDLFLFNIVRVPSLKALGLSSDELFSKGLLILDMQMAGMLIGGILWGILGDKKGRLSVLFGSILLYSLANIANGFVTSYDQYLPLRFIAGIGLAGELGAGITLVAEILPKEIRGWGTTLVATTGVFGAILAYFVASAFDWRISYFVGGALGLILLLMRVRVFESGVFLHLKHKNVQRGNFFMLFSSGARFSKYLYSILIGTPIWFVSGVLIFFSPEFGAALGVTEPIEAGKAVMLAFAGQVAGDLVSGYLSQRFKSRKKGMLIFLLGSYTFMLVYLLVNTTSLPTFYFFCAALGFFNGYWTLFITIAAELFGTNLRATVATTVPNFVRASVIPISALFVFAKAHFGLTLGAAMVGGFIVAIALWALSRLEETFHKELDYHEEDALDPSLVLPEVGNPDSLTRKN
ncbi:MFS transporter [Adhaeribacter pallidiroseus]|uniref:Solute carrier family 22 member n=1 Tax=Adhaeribacter pallidiroseus TaxID=2072847 RepID=A0A369QJP7_9BACT|nr:MFS transporter [Adhaeribacter pallidiroseus]RDC63089.1 Solute carrier family 22 member [Adhaeribacter pallidiroseus]